MLGLFRRHPIAFIVGVAMFAVLAVPIIGLAQGGLPPRPDYSQYPPEKRALLEANDPRNLMATAQAAPPIKDLSPKSEGPTPPPQKSSSVQRAGAGSGTIMETGLAPYPAGQFVGINRWEESKSGNDLIVYAGSNGSDPSQGLIIVQIISASSHQTVGGAILPTPVKAGPVRVSAAQGEVLTLTGQNGTTFFFDVGLQKFVAAAR